jgi:hypothetical protein
VVKRLSRIDTRKPLEHYVLVYFNHQWMAHKNAFKMALRTARTELNNIIRIVNDQEPEKVKAENYFLVEQRPSRAYKFEHKHMLNRAKGYCKTCWIAKNLAEGTAILATACAHVEKPVRALGLCNQCYQA